MTVPPSVWLEESADAFIKMKISSEVFTVTSRVNTYERFWADVFVSTLHRHHKMMEHLSGRWMDPSARFPVSRNQCWGILKVCVEVQQPPETHCGFFFPPFIRHPPVLFFFVCVCVLILIMAFKSCSNGFPQRNGAEGDLAVIAHERPFHFLFLPFLLSFSYSPPWSFNTFSQIDVSTAAVINSWKYRQRKCSLQLLWRDTCAVQVAQAHIIAFNASKYTSLWPK